MASDKDNLLTRSTSRILRFLGLTSSSEFQDVGQNTPAQSVNYGVFSSDELRHLDGVATRLGKLPTARVPTEEGIGTYLQKVVDDTHSKIYELRDLTTIAPEITVAKRVIVSTIMSPQDLNTNTVKLSLNYEGLSPEVKTNILGKLNTFFNQEYHLASKLYSWLATAGFEEGAKAILVLPKHELDVQNAIADALSAQETKNLIVKEDLCPSLEGYSGPDRDSIGNELQNIQDAVQAELEIALENLGSEKFFKEHTPFTESVENKKITIGGTTDLATHLREGMFKLLRRNGDGTVVVTRDVKTISKANINVSDKLKDLLRDAEAQFSGFTYNEKTGKAEVVANTRSYYITDNIRVGEGDLPIVIELPAECVIPVCAPRDNKNHIGYFVMLDEQGQPVSGNTNYFKSGSTDVTNRLAMTAAKAIYGNATLTSFAELANSPKVVLQQMTDVFAVAVNKLLAAKLGREGLTGLDINMHNAVGKALFMNLLAKNKIKLVFVPEPMMVYYRFDHRDDGTGKTFLEDVGQMLALRTTLMVARLMAAIDNATVHRTIEMDLDEKETNPLQAIQIAVRQALSKYAPSFSTEVQTAAESLVNRNITVRPKSMAGTTDNLSVSIDKQYGNSQAPDTDIMDKLNNWIAMGLGGLPASVLNQLSENEFSRSVATTNMYFANTVSGWQESIKPYNKKFVCNYISCSSRLVEIIRHELEADKGGEPEKLKENKSSDVVDEKISKQIRMIISSIDVDLPPPEMAAKKAHFEEINAYMEMIQKAVEVIYADDIVVDEELKGSMNTVRAAIVSQLLREFLPRLGCQAIADIPEPNGVNADYAKNIFLYLSNLRARIKHLSDLVKGNLPPDGNGNQNENQEGNEETQNGGQAPTWT